MHKVGTYLAFDYGTRKIGVAVGQTVTLTANPLNPLLAHQGLPDWNQISKLIDQWQPVGFIVGIPLNMDGSVQTITKKALAFANELSKRYNMPVHQIDERLTTVEAKQKLFDLGGYKALKETSVDSFAAKLMLEAWMRSSG